MAQIIADGIAPGNNVMAEPIGQQAQVAIFPQAVADNIENLFMIQAHRHAAEGRHGCGMHYGPEKVSVNQVIAVSDQKKEHSSEHMSMQAAVSMEGVKIMRKEAVNRYPPVAQEVPVVAIAAQSQDFGLEKLVLAILDDLADYFLGAAGTQVVDNM